jgi:hypothetical protein
MDCASVVGTMFLQENKLKIPRHTKEAMVFIFDWIEVGNLMKKTGYSSSYGC